MNFLSVIFKGISLNQSGILVNCSFSIVHFFGDHSLILAWNSHWTFLYMQTRWYISITLGCPWNPCCSFNTIMFVYLFKRHTLNTSKSFSLCTNCSWKQGLSLTFNFKTITACSHFDTWHWSIYKESELKSKYCFENKITKCTYPGKLDVSKAGLSEIRHLYMPWAQKHAENIRKPRIVIHVSNTARETLHSKKNDIVRCVSKKIEIPLEICTDLSPPPNLWHLLYIMCVRRV